MGTPPSQGPPVLPQARPLTGGAMPPHALPKDGEPRPITGSSGGPPPAPASNGSAFDIAKLMEQQRAGGVVPPHLAGLARPPGAVVGAVPPFLPMAPAHPGNLQASQASAVHNALIMQHVNRGQGQLDFFTNALLLYFFCHPLIN